MSVFFDGGKFLSCPPVSVEYSNEIRILFEIAHSVRSFKSNIYTRNSLQYVVKTCLYAEKLYVSLFINHSTYILRILCANLLNAAEVTVLG